MTLEDAHNLKLRLQLQGDADAAEAVGVLIVALEAADEPASKSVPLYLMDGADGEYFDG